MSNQEPDFEKSKKWHWIPLAGMAAAVAFALFGALYEDASDEPLKDAARNVELLNYFRLVQSRQTQFCE